METYALVCMIVFFSGLTLGSSGFGAIIPSLPLLPILLDIKTDISLLGVFGLVIPLLPLIQLRKHPDSLSR
jgi:hypothetical protein